MANEFDYVKYDETSTHKQALLKGHFADLLRTLKSILPASREQSLAITNLQQAYMWLGHAIKNEQIARNPATDLQEGRGNE